MLKHIVLWTIEDQPDGTSAEEVAREAKRRLESLAGRIPGLLHIEAGVDISAGEGTAGLALYSELVDRVALEGYQTHPEHVAVGRYVGSLDAVRTAVDYEV